MFVLGTEWEWEWGGGQIYIDFSRSSLYDHFFVSRGNLHWDLGIIINIATSLNPWRTQGVNSVDRFLYSELGTPESGRWLMQQVDPDCDPRGSIALVRSLGVFGALEGQKGQEESFGNHFFRELGGICLMNFFSLKEDDRKIQ